MLNHSFGFGVSVGQGNRYPFDIGIGYTEGCSYEDQQKQAFVNFGCTEEFSYESQQKQVFSDFYIEKECDIIKEKQEDNKISFAVLLGNKNGIAGCTDGRSTENDRTVLSDNFRKVWKFEEKQLIVTSTGTNHFLYSDRFFDTEIVEDYYVGEAVKEAVDNWNGKDVYDLAGRMHDRFAAPVYKMSKYYNMPASVAFSYGFFHEDGTVMASSRFYRNKEEFHIERTFETKCIISGKFHEIINYTELPDYNAPVEELETFARNLVQQAITLDKLVSKKPVVGGQIFLESMKK